jgi:hypothetical protein
MQAALSIEWATLSPAGVTGVAEGAPGAVDALSAVGAAGTVPAVSGLPPTLGGSVLLGAGVAPAVGGASTDAQFSSSPTVRGGIAGVVVEAESGPGVVWLVFLFFFFFSSFFSSASPRSVAGVLTRRRARPSLSCSKGLRLVAGA